MTRRLIPMRSVGVAFQSGDRVVRPGVGGVCFERFDLKKVIVLAVSSLSVASEMSFARQVLLASRVPRFLRSLQK